MIGHGNRRAPVTARTPYGDAELRPDPVRPDGWTLLVDGVPQSYVDPTAPRHLPFAYVRWFARLLDVMARPGAPLRVLHLGGGGLTLPRYVAATRPGSPQRVVEHDAQVVALVSQVLPPPPGVVVEVGDAGAFVERAAAETSVGSGGYDVLLVDVFAGAALPAAVAGTGFATAAARLLRRTGLVAMNVTDVPPLAFSRIQAATLRAALPRVCLVAGAGMVRGRRAGNVVLVGGVDALPVGRLAAAVGRGRESARVLHGAAFDGFVAGARPRLDTPR